MKRWMVLLAGFGLGVMIWTATGAYSGWNYNTADLNGASSIQSRVDDLDTRLDAAGMTSATTALTPTFTTIGVTGGGTLSGTFTGGTFTNQTLKNPTFTGTEAHAGHINGAADVSTWNQYVVMGPDQSVMLRMRVGTCTNGQVVAFAASNFTSVAQVWLSCTNATADQTNAPFASSVSVSGFTANGPTGAVMNWLAIGAH